MGSKLSGRPKGEFLVVGLLCLGGFLKLFDIFPVDGWGADEAWQLLAGALILAGAALIFFERPYGAFLPVVAILVDSLLYEGDLLKLTGRVLFFTLVMARVFSSIRDRLAARTQGVSADLSPATPTDHAA